MKNPSETSYNSELAIEVHGLSKSYGKVQALRGIDLEVRPGEIFSFLGPNGAGKTTTIRCLLDMIRPDAGSVHLFGINPQISPVTVQGFTGYLPGEVQYYENMTAERQLRFFGDMYNGRTDWKYAQDLAERLSLNMKQAIKNLSKGNKQKIGVIQALMHHPKLLLLDEPTSGLDPLMQQEVLSMIREANAAGATVFFSSHIMSEVENLAGRVAIIRSGEIVETAETNILTHRSVRRLTIRLKQPVSSQSIGNLPGVEVLASSDNTSFTLQVTGDMEKLVKALGDYPVLDLETYHPSLEETFLAYYK
jgi:ABC-2 type transport system ATP-binding protein